MPDLGPNFARPVPRNGYAWWYVDALSEDQAHGLTIIAFIGSVFSPYYAWARRQHAADPYDHCALNVALYGAAGHRWAMTERPRAATEIEADRFRIGPSALRWDGTALRIEIDERTVPLPSVLRGTVTIRPRILHRRVFDLGGTGRHSWHPLAPLSTVAVDFERPRLSWQGAGYLDMNFGEEPLEAGFRQWDWARLTEGQMTRVFYNAEDRSGAHHRIAVEFGAAGDVQEFEPPEVRNLPRTFWRMPRATRASGTVSVRDTLEDSPFYARSLLSIDAGGPPALAFHESLSLDRFRHPVVQMMLPFRMPRAFWQR